MNPVTEHTFLPCGTKLVDAVCDWLKESRARTDPAGAASLAHVCVVVPTAQSGRNIRLALARRFPNGLVPPMVVQPMQLARDATDVPPVATKVQLGAAFLRFMETCEEGGAAARWPHLFLPDALSDSDALLSFFDQLEDLWRLLGAGGLLMRDVPENANAATVLEAAEGDEAVRWKELAQFETAFFAFLHDHGLRHEAERLHDAKSTPPDIPDDIEEVVLPAMVDPVPLLCDILSRQRISRRITVLIHADEGDRAKFDDWGRPLVECWTGTAHPDLQFGEGAIVCASTDGKLAEKIADDFPECGADAALPSLGLCDEGLYNELSAAFLERGYELHNPEKYRLVASSLGRIAGRLLSLYAAGGGAYPWEDFTALLRENDVLNGSSRFSVLKGLDVCRNVFYPSVLPTDCSFDLARVAEWDRGCAADFLEAAKALRAQIEGARSGAPNAAAYLRAAFHALYATRTLGTSTADREFAAAIGALRDVLAQFDGDILPGLGLADSGVTALLRKSLADATYSLEPDAPDALMTEGWLELAWSPNDKIALAGFNEGAVPDSVSGHVFLPDALRFALGLPSNDQRLARDTFLLKSIFDARARGDVRAYYARTSDAGDIHRPSRLLFLVDDGHLAVRVKALFGALPPDRPRPPRRVEAGWRPRLPLDVAMPHVGEDATPEGRLSASAIDKWLSCPLTYLLQYGLGMERVEEKNELEANDFGTLVHAALEAYAEEQLARTGDGFPQQSDERDIRASLTRIFAGIRAGYGSAPSLKIRLQLDAAEARLANFAVLQAHWAQEGWQVVEKPEFGFVVRPFAGEGDADVSIKGKIDRLDYKEGVGYRLIDYKTWDDASKAGGHILSSGKAECEFAAALGLPVLPAVRGNTSPRRFLSVQLPLYRRCLEMLDPAKFGGRVADCCYLVLGKNGENTRIFGSGSESRDAFGTGSVELSDPDINQAALETARTAIRAIRANLFWPPGPGNALRYDFKDIFLNSPENDLKDSDWLAQQKMRLAAFAEGRDVQ